MFKKMKSQLKNQILEKRNALTNEEAAEKSKAIIEKLFSLDEYQKSKSVMFYVSIKNEVGTREAINESLKSKSVIVPKVKIGEIEPSLIISLDNLIEGKFGVLEPIESMIVPFKKIDLVIVPGIAFDKKCHRIGYGLGYYDKFLKKVPKAVKIGLCFDFQLVDEIPNESHDVPVDIIITDENIIRQNSQPFGL